MQPQGLQHTRLPCPSPTPRAYSNSCPLSRWSHSTTSSSVVPFSSHLQSFSASGSFQMIQLFPAFNIFLIQFSSFQLVSHIWLFAIPWTAACQASLSVTSSWSLFKLMSIASVMPSNYLILCHPFLLPPSILLSSQFFASGGQSIGVSVSASVLPMNLQDWFPLGWTGWISLLSKGLSRVFSNTTV